MAAQTGSLTLEVLCGESLVWDLPRGQIGPRGAAPGTAAARMGNVTLKLTAGARVRVEASAVGALRLAVDRVDSLARRCGAEGVPSFQATLDGTSLPHDPAGFFYDAVAGSKPDVGAVSVPLKGRVQLGRPIQHGGGWKGTDGGMSESILVTRRVVPAFSHERVTLSTDRLDDGSVLDTHACLDSVTDDPWQCAGNESEPATGFLRASPGKGLEIQLHVRGPVGVKTYEGNKQYLVSIPNSSFAWQSEPVKYWFAFLVLVFSFWEKIVKPLEGGSKKSGSEGESMNKTAVHEVTGGSGHGESYKRTGNRSSSTTTAIVVSMLTLMPFLLPTPAWAEPVEVRQEGNIGAGYTFRRGSSCNVVTANHVVKEIGVPITVEDKTGARIDGSRTFSSSEMDLALISLPDNSAVACTTPWPDVGWLRSASFSGASAFRVVRHYTSGREAIVRLAHAGGDRNHFSLAPVDKLNIRESDSGSIVEFEGKLAGIVISIDTSTDRVRVLRFDRIDELVGDRFRGAAGARLVSFLGVVQNGIENPNWSKYAQAWITEKAGRAVITPTRSGGQAPNCTVL